MTGVLPRPLYEPESAASGSIVALSVSKCATCGRHEFPYRDRCPSCRSDSVPALLSTRAHVVGFTSVSHSPPGALVDVPYVVATAAFPEGLSVLGRVVGVGLDELAIGDAVDTVAAEVGDGTHYAYRLAIEADR